ncbi:unnamed protein product [Plutella xylostella]|uniref:(diamondback moth) hypothetical protein n=1 Tax=Plutella xylostella TaxID=51655 RepID=A0A8S4GBU0_PLUXY|nr:unnamed protein product [Plutella xylostella]
MESHKLWEQSLGSSTDIATFTQLSAFLETRFRSMEMMSTSQISHQKEYTRTTPQTQKPTFVKTFVTEENTIDCTYCHQNHYICHCKEFAALDVAQRHEFVKENEICFNCLVKGHRLKDCRSSTSCWKCGRRHHTLLHIKYDNVKTAQQEPEKDEAVTLKTETITGRCHSAQVLLATALISVVSKSGETHTLRALIDQASQASFITEAAAQLLGLDRTYVNGKITGISDTSVISTKSMVKLTLLSTTEQAEFTTNAYVLKKLSSLLPAQELSKDAWPTHECMKLADPQYYKPGSIDVLLGAEVHAQIIQDGIKRHNSLIALNSRLGWIISGKVTQTNVQPHNIVVAHTKMEVDQLLRQFWEIEEYIPHKKPMTKEEIQCEEHFKKTHTREAGRYVVSLPFKDETSPEKHLGDSKPLAVQRLLQLEKRFKRRPELKVEYSNFLTNYEDQSHMEKVPETEKQRLDGKKPYYLPHHAVIRESSTSTKLRVVFDGSAKPVKGNSINEELLIGPPLQQDIRDLVTRWRQHKYCLVADIKQMYRQIRITKDDSDYQRILWRETPDEPISEYRLLTVTYGTSCAPFLAIRTLHQLASDECEEFPEEAAILKTDMYMDDLLTGASTEEHAVILQKRMTQLLSRGGLPLHKWSSNSELVMSKIPESVKDSQSEVNIKVDHSIKALGIKWQPKSDNFEMKIVMDTNENMITKRNVLAMIAKTFDPLGWIAPCIIVLKIFMQKLWLAGLTWDNELTEELKKEWLTYLDNFIHMEPIQLPRWMEISESTTTIELHGFSDASMHAMGAVVYCRVVDSTGAIKITMIAAKSKVAPVKTISMPRLELCGAVLLSKLLYDTKTSLKIKDNCVFAWTDSTIVLAWLRKNPNSWTTFVANRTTEILNVTNSSQWNHVTSENNPADYASRGLSPKEIQEAELWWEGPPFLKQHVEINCPPFVEPENCKCRAQRGHSSSTSYPKIKLAERSEAFDKAERSEAKQSKSSYHKPWRAERSEAKHFKTLYHNRRIAERSEAIQLKYNLTVKEEPSEARQNKSKHHTANPGAPSEAKQHHSNPRQHN